MGGGCRQLGCMMVVDACGRRLFFELVVMYDFICVYIIVIDCVEGGV